MHASSFALEICIGYLYLVFCVYRVLSPRRCLRAFSENATVQQPVNCGELGILLTI